MTEDGTYRFRVHEAGRYRVSVGAKIGDEDAYTGTVFGGASVRVSQDNIVFTDMGALTAHTAKEVVLKAGQLRFEVSSAGGTTSIGVSIQKIY